MARALWLLSRIGVPLAAAVVATGAALDAILLRKMGRSLRRIEPDDAVGAASDGDAAR